MAKKALVFSHDKWAPLDQAYIRVKAAVGSRDLAERDLLDLLRSKRLRSAVRRICIENARTEVFEPLPLSFWETPGLRLRESEGKVSVRGRYPEKCRTWHSRFTWFFVMRSDLDKLKPYPPAPPQAEQAGHEVETSTHRKPGQKTTKNWPLHVVGELHRIVVVENKPVPPASYFANFCVTKLKYHPDISAIQKLLKQFVG